MAYKNPHDPRLLQKRREHYHANKEQYFARNRQQKLDARAFIVASKDVPCADCGNRYPSYVMDFDHLGDKKFNISNMTARGMAQLQAEIAKCEVVCSNCHRIRTHERLVEKGLAQDEKDVLD